MNYIKLHHYQNKYYTLKGALDNVENFLFDWILFIILKVIASKQMQKEKFKNLFRKWRNHQFFDKRAQTGD